MRLMRFLLRLFGFVQWLAAMVIGALCVVAHVDTLNKANESTTVESFADLAYAFDQTLVSVHLTLPGLLVSILLLMSAIYCDRAGAAIARPTHRNARPSPETESSSAAQTASPYDRVE